MRQTTITPAIRARVDGRTVGVGLALVTAAISGVAVFLNASAVRQVPDPAVYTTLKNAVAAVVLLGVLVATHRWNDLRTIPARRWPALLAVGIVGGSIPFVLFFTGLAAASAPGAAFIHKTLFLWVALFALPLLGERAGIATVIGLVALLGGQALVVPPRDVAWGAGETMILAATILWAVETILVKRLLGETPALVGGALRMTIGVVVLVGYLVVSGRIAGVAMVGAAGWAWVALTGVILAGYVGTWFAALRLAPATVVTSVLVVGAIVTAALSSISTGAAPGPSVIGGYGLILAAVTVVVLGMRAAVRDAAGRPEQPFATSVAGR
jgi:drug/metabolite transporter (DMT)-like permease